MQVQIVRLKLFAMLNKNIIAVGPRIARLNDASVARGVNRSAARSRIIGTAMGSLGFVDGVQSIRVEVRADAREIQWGA